jgi:CHAD domain-containing protein
MDLGTVLETYRVNLAHARRVADHALALFDAVAPRYGLAAGGRRLLEIGALLHNVGLTTDPPAHHLVGRDIVLRHDIEGLSAGEQLLVAALVAFHRKRVRPRLEPAFLALGKRERRAARGLAAILRVADGLDYSQSQTTELAVVAGAVGPVLQLAGPQAGLDGLRAAAKADLWAKEFGETLSVEGAEGQPLPLPPEQADEVEGAGADLLPPWYASSEAPLAELGRVLLRRHLRRLLEAERGVRADRAIEDVHALRVATRRLRATLRLLEPVGPARLRAHGKAIGRLARAAGAVRDRDVLLADLEKRGPELPAALAPSLAALAGAVRAERAEAHGRLLGLLDGRRHDAFVREFAAVMCGRDGWDDGPRVRDLAGGTLWRHYEALRAYDVGGLPAEEEPLHAMRIEGKRLRYVLELFAETFGERGDEVVAPLMAFQDHLGGLNDVAVARVLLAPHARDDDAGPAAAAYLALREQDALALRAELPPRWAELGGEAYRRKLMELIVGL